MIRRYVNRPAPNGPTIAFDEFGPLEIRPQSGRSWRPRGKPDRQPATYTRPHGVQHWLAFYDVHANQLWGYTRDRKRHGEFLDVLKKLRKRYGPEQRIHLILDNFSPHRTLKVRRWCRKNNIHLIWTPTNASWLNPIECHFTPIKRFVLDNTYYANHDELRRALQLYVNYRNKQARKKL